MNSISIHSIKQRTYTLLAALTWLLPTYCRQLTCNRIKSKITNSAILTLNPLFYTPIGAENYEDTFSDGYFHSRPVTCAHNKATASSLYCESCSVGITNKGGVRN